MLEVNRLCVQADLNGDGHLDVVVIQPDLKLQVCKLVQWRVICEVCKLVQRRTVCNVCKLVQRRVVCEVCSGHIIIR